MEQDPLLFEIGPANQQKPDQDGEPLLESDTRLVEQTWPPPIAEVDPAEQSQLLFG